LINKIFLYKNTTPNDDDKGEIDVPDKVQDIHLGSSYRSLGL
jgi:hypothetical protein